MYVYNQVVAITICFLLATAFYVFLAPFLWIGGLESAAFALYSPLVCILRSLSRVEAVGGLVFSTRRSCVKLLCRVPDVEFLQLAVHYGLTALHALLGDQPGRPWCFEESAFIQA